MENEDTKRESPAVRRDPGATFVRAMAGVVAACERLAVALSSCDVSNVEHLSRQAASHWLTGYSARRHTVMRSDASVMTDDGKALMEGRATLLELFARAKEYVVNPRVRGMLDELIALVANADMEIASEIPSRDK